MVASAVKPPVSVSSWAIALTRKFNERVFILPGRGDGGIEVQTGHGNVLTLGPLRCLGCGSPGGTLAQQHLPSTPAPGSGAVAGPIPRCCWAAGSMAIAGAVGGQMRQEKVVKDFAAARDTRETTDLQKRQRSRYGTKSLKVRASRFLVNMAVNQGISM